MKRTQSIKVAEPDSAVSVSLHALIALSRYGAVLTLGSRKIAARQAGGYLSAFKGRGMEFDEVRHYLPGDDVRNLDWRVTARTGKAHTKLYREERERPVLLWVDFRRSMFFATRGVFKSVIAARAAAILAWSAINHGDKLGGLLFAEQAHRALRPQSGRSAALHMLHQLVAYAEMPSQVLSTEAAWTSEQALLRLRHVARPGSLIFLLSDCRDFSHAVERQLAQLAIHNELVVMMIYDPLEQSLPPAGTYTISDGSQHFMTLDTRSVAERVAYERRFEARVEHLQTFCRHHRIQVLSCSTQQDIVKILMRELGGRFAAR